MKNDTDLPQSVTILEHVQKPTKQRFFVLGILFVSLSIIYLDRVNISIIAANTHFLNEMHLNDKPILVGLLMSLFLASYGIANVFLSPLGDYIGPRRAMLIAYVVISLSLLIGGLSSFFAILLGTRILLGIGEGLYYPMQNTIIKNWFPAGERGRANTAWILGQSLAPALAMPLYTWIIAEHSWRHTFYFSFSLTLLPIVLIYFFTSNFPQENKYVNVLELQKINKSTTEEVLHKNSSEKISVVERAKVYLCNSNQPVYARCSEVK
ncbi:MFS transporter [Klebsiella pneumoniae]